LSKSKGSGDVFVVKLNPLGSSISPALGGYSAFLGGSSADTGLAIAVDGGGNAYVTGKTTSKDFPVLGGFLTSPSVAGGDPAGDGFVTKLNAAGTAILYSTYLYSTYPGTYVPIPGADMGLGIAVDGGGNAYVTGATASSTGQAVFIAKLNPGLTGGPSLLYFVSRDGSGSDTGYGIAVDPSCITTSAPVPPCNVYVTGQTFSSDFPFTENAFQKSLSGASDAFVLKLDPNGSVLYSTYFGGTGDESGNAIAVDASGKIYVTGFTKSSTIGTPPLPGSNAGSQDAFVAQFDPSLSGTASVVYFTFLGGTGDDVANGIAVDAMGMAYVAGTTTSSNFPTTLSAFDTK